jgi:two-component system chemotaxis response regulator CheY
MQMIETSTENDRILKLPATLDLPAVRELVDALNDRLPKAKHFWLDASQVESVTLPFIQAALAAVKSGNVSVIDPSDAFVRAFNDHGLAWDHQPAVLPAQEIGANDAEPSRATEAGQDAGPASNKRILTIDDSKTMRDMLRLTLSSHGFDVLQAVDGQDGLNVLAKESVDVVITDINMPVMDGFGVIERMRNIRQYDSTPILVLTTESDKEKKERARKLGATGFIVKPFNPVGLVDAIRKVSPGC